MNTIAVLTDFSEKSTHAVRFALHIAKRMKANVTLFSLKAVPAWRELQVNAGYDLLTDSDPSTDDELAEFTLKMELDLQQRTFPGAFLPNLTYNPEATDIVDIMTTIVNDSQVSLVVTAPPGKDDLCTYLLSDEARKMMEWSTVPVLVVPSSAPIKNFEKIAFITNLLEGDLLSITELNQLTGAFSSQLMIAHLNEKPADQQLLDAEKKFCDALYKTRGCYGAHFRSISDAQNQNDWEWLKANKQTDLLSVVLGNRTQMPGHFNRGRNPHATYHLTIPVMVLPKRP
jgi:nucleotide-binding universal stress UspA family protein